ncbi:MAG: hypothetical protein G5663_01740 [Serratia symbiotica]|nr:hypothetical protein [Serratia symbiotica]
MPQEIHHQHRRDDGVGDTHLNKRYADIIGMAEQPDADGFSGEQEYQLQAR